MWGSARKGCRKPSREERLFKKEGYVFDVAYTSVLKRAIKTLWIVLEEMDLMWISRSTGAGGSTSVTTGLFRV